MKGTAAVATATTESAVNAAAPGAEEVALKKNTDCVYFLASPLTCKKGNECEFRHSESARINPRDCWYWLSGSCLNRDCSFRHPPLDGKPAPPPAPPPVPPPPINSKGRTPCYYYLQGYCARGDRCSFMHGVPGVVAAPAPQTVPAPAPVPPAPAPKAAPVPEPVVEQEILKPEAVIAGVPNVQAKAGPAPAATRSTEDPAPKTSATSVPPRNGTFDRNASRSSEPVDSFVDEEESPTNTRTENGGREPEDRWEESSPGFDVLVDNEPEEIQYGGGEDRNAGEDRGFDEDMDPLVYGYPEYTPSGGYEERGPYERPSFNHYDRHEYDRGSNYDHGSSFDQREQHMSYEPPFHHIDYDRPRYEQPDIYRRLRVVESYAPRPEISVKDRLSFNNGDRRALLDNGDLRNHLEKRRRLDSVDRYRRDGHLNQEAGYRFHRQQDEYERVHHEQRRQQQQQQYHYMQQQGRMNGRRSRERSMDHRRFDYPVDEQVGFVQQRPRNHQQSDRKNSREALTPTPRQGGAGYRRTEQRPNGDFAAPKSLAQIRAEKRKFQGEEGQANPLRKCAAAEDEKFSGPKPLSEILKEKRNAGSEDGSNYHLLEADGLHLNNGDLLHDSGAVAAGTGSFSDDDDDDDFARKLAEF